MIRRLLQTHEVASQEDLGRLLLGEGVRCTQATLSRDLRDMGVVRVRGLSGPRYELDERARYMRALREVVGMEILDVRHNGQLVVLRTLAGRAEGVAGFLDALGDARVLGTIAGDDTVFLAPSDPSRCDDVVAMVQALVEGTEP
ncbi:MAG: arginine repressor [Alphaproteobacteria bacterium]|nr:arginine repressor [Alphaproteobacteria bacterium]